MDAGPPAGDRPEGLYSLSSTKATPRQIAPRGEASRAARQRLDRSLAHFGLPAGAQAR